MRYAMLWIRKRENKMVNETPLLEIENLHINFMVDKRQIHAVQGLNLTMYEGQTVAIVGESGSGKSTTAHAIIDLLPDTGHVTSGSIEFQGNDLTKADDATMESIRGSKIGLVPQDPMSNLNPLYKVGVQVKEVVEVNDIAGPREADARVIELLEEAGLDNAAARAAQ